jgi:tetratricopeptide (TPR) repeat protein/transcriptional regulator with XRE-family HTH domain
MDKGEAGDIISFGYWVQQRRTALDLTRPELARRVGCSPVTVKKIERDERRPSRQIAELLADHLVIPDKDRATFIRLARGGFVGSPLSAPDLISLPPFLRSLDQAAKSDEPPFVARERELAQLETYLGAALTGQGGLVFISGEAGTGKTVLAQEFVRQSQEKHPGLVAVNGNCNAHTGIGDPYLPFRETLELLSGDIEPGWVAGTMSQTYAQRLWALVPHTVQALLEAGPDLVNSFICAAALVSRATAAAPEDEGRLEQLKTLVTRQPAGQAPSLLQQGNLFAQYTRVLQILARQKPLLLIIDDLQWADAGSISLLFHLGRHLKGQRILIVGLYRPSDVALGREGERHPLEPVINELQRQFGDTQVRLRQAEGKRFVDAILDIEPNRLGPSFRAALHLQTGGHPLFTVEMLRSLRERGDLVHDEQGQWIEGSAPDWKTLPARIEGVIKERVGRLSLPLQEALKVASVEGNIFTAEVVAHVLGSDERQMTAQLSRVLGQEQRLIKVQGSQQLGPTQLSQYRFRHILFQQYLYDNLDQGERGYLHQAIGNELEQLHEQQAKAVAPQLARHFAAAGDAGRALKYFSAAGDMAAAVYANTEAEAHYRRALKVASTDQGNPEQPAYSQQLLQLYTRLGRTLELSARYDGAIAIYEEMERAAQVRDDQAMVLASLLARAAIRTTVNFARDPVQGQILLERARNIARELGDRAAEAKILWNLLILNAYTGGDPNDRLAHGEQALAFARELDLSEQLAFTLHDIFYAYAGSGQWDRARSSLYEARDLWQRLGNLPMLSEAFMRLHWIYLVSGDYEQAIAHAEEAYRLGLESHNLDAQALSHFMIGFVHWERGQIDQALTTMEEDIAIAESVNSLTPLIGTRADLGLLYGELGDVNRGLALADLARATAEEQLPILRFWPHAIQVILQLRQGNTAVAEELMATLADYQTVKAQFGYMPFMWIRVGLAHGEFALQQQAFDQALPLMETLYTDLCEASIWYLRPDVLRLKGRALLGLGSYHLEEAREVLLKARAAAETLGSRRALWPVLVSLAEVACQCGDDATAETLRQEASVIVEGIADHIRSPQLRTTFLT